MQVSGGGLHLLGQRNTEFSGLLSMPGGASFNLSSSLNPPGSEVITLLARQKVVGTLKQHIL
jgi:hypothetical protein